MAGSVICSRCGQANEADQTFCASCGAFLEWSGQRVEGEAAPEASGATQAPAVQAGPAVLAGPAGDDQAGLAQPRASQVEPPPLVTPVRPGVPSRRVGATPAEAVEPAAPAPTSTGAPAVTAPAVTAPTIGCPSCGRPNPVERTFCHSCGTLLRPKPPEPARRRSGSGRAGLYRLLSLLLLLAIIIVGSFLLTRLTSSSSTPPGVSPTPSPTRAWTAPVNPAGRLGVALRPTSALSAAG